MTPEERDHHWTNVNYMMELVKNEGDAQCERAFDFLLGEVRAERGEKDGAYRERNRVVAMLAALYPSSLERHPDNELPWDEEWRWIVFVDLPTGQATWHLHDSHLGYFSHVPRLQGRVWDGHSTEEKYGRLARLAHTLPAPAAP